MAREKGKQMFSKCVRTWTWGWINDFVYYILIIFFIFCQSKYPENMAFLQYFSSFCTSPIYMCLLFSHVFKEQHWGKEHTRVQLKLIKCFICESSLKMAAYSWTFMYLNSTIFGFESCALWEWSPNLIWLDLFWFNEVIQNGKWS